MNPFPGEENLVSFVHHLEVPFWPFLSSLCFRCLVLIDFLFCIFPMKYAFSLSFQEVGCQACKCLRFFTYYQLPIAPLESAPTLFLSFLISNTQCIVWTTSSSGGMTSSNQLLRQMSCHCDRGYEVESTIIRV